MCRAGTGLDPMGVCAMWAEERNCSRARDAGSHFAWQCAAGTYGGQCLHHVVLWTGNGNADTGVATCHRLLDAREIELILNVNSHGSPGGDCLGCPVDHGVSTVGTPAE
ncbi:hypothetical protein CJ178_18440 [Rhodococcus sp. ACPA4]|nr:hypothetical protein CJ178_18440 [Rhodococcus sp. ACPA4]